MRVCIEDGCPTLTRTTRCPAHTRAKDKARGTRQQRGYDAAHDKLRAEYQRRMDAGERFTCWRCPRPIDPSDWHLGHDDHDRSKYRGPECPPCNLATSGRKGTRVTVVCGPPCSGKTTWVRERAQPGDLIVDYDDIARRLGSPRQHDHHPSFHKPVEAAIARAIAGIKQGRHARAWVIRSGVARARSIADELGGQLVILDESDEVLTARAQARANPAATIRAIQEWRRTNRVSHM